MEAKSGAVQRMHSVSSDDKQAIDQYICADSSQNPIVEQQPGPFKPITGTLGSGLDFLRPSRSLLGCYWL